MVCNAHRYVAIVGVHHCDKNGPGFGKAQFSGADCQWWFHHAGMPEVHVAASALYDPKLKGRVALISDTRVSGVSSGAVGVHCAPEAALGGPIEKTHNPHWLGLPAWQNPQDTLLGESLDFGVAVVLQSERLRG